MSLSGVGFHFFVDGDPDAGYWLIFTMWHSALAAEHQFQFDPSPSPLQARGPNCVSTRVEADTATS